MTCPKHPDDEIYGGICMECATDALKAANAELARLVKESADRIQRAPFCHRHPNCLWFIGDKCSACLAETKWGQPVPDRLVRDVIRSTLKSVEGYDNSTDFSPEVIEAERIIAGREAK